MDSFNSRIKLEEEQQEFDEEDKRKDMFHYLFQAKDPETGETAYSKAEVDSFKSGAILKLTSLAPYRSKSPHCRRIRHYFDNPHRSVFQSFSKYIHL